MARKKTAKKTTKKAKTSPKTSRKKGTRKKTASKSRGGWLGVSRGDSSKIRGSGPRKSRVKRHHPEVSKHGKTAAARRNYIEYRKDVEAAKKKHFG